MSESLAESFDQAKEVKEAQETKIAFWTPRLRQDKKKRLHPTVYQIYLCIKCKLTLGENEVGAWSALIIKQQQGNFMMKNDSPMTYMINGIEHSSSHIQIRLAGVKEVLDWITVNIDPEEYNSIEATIVCNDVFVVNTLREWLPKWVKSDFSTLNAELGHGSVFKSLAAISTKIRLNVEWRAENSTEMYTLSEKIMEMLSSEE